MADYIRRTLAKAQFTGNFQSEYPTALIHAILDDVPSEDVRPVVKAKWELDNDKLPICSNCGEIALQRIFVKIPNLIQDVRMVKSNFCPNCGAKMEES